MLFSGTSRLHLQLGIGSGLDGAAATLESHGHLDQSRKVAFLAQALASDIPCDPRLGMLSPDFVNCLERSIQSSPAELREWREEQICHIERVALSHIESGRTADWLASADPAIQRISASVNGPLLCDLIQLSGHCDTSMPELFRSGASVSGVLPSSGTGFPVDAVAVPTPVESLAASRSQANAELCRTILDTEHSAVLLEKTRDDAELGRMSSPVPLDDPSCCQWLLARRFAVVQGSKVRPCDDETASGLNGACAASEKLSHDRVDSLVCAVDRFTASTGLPPYLYKADIDSAFRRVPVCPAERWLLGVVFSCAGTLYVSQHLALPFGSTGSVHGWHRVGAALCVFARSLLALSIFQYVDDYFGLEHPVNAAHALQCFVRLVRAVLGPGAIADKKTDVGQSLGILGLLVHPQLSGITVALLPEKRVKWLAEIKDILAQNRLGSGRASKLAGRLCFASLLCFWRLGRAMVRPLFAQQYSPLPGGRMRRALTMALRWWVIVLEQCSFEPILTCPCSPVLDLLCDARSTPPRVSAVLCSPSGSLLYTDWAPPLQLIQRFAHRYGFVLVLCSASSCALHLRVCRGDGHIMSLELLAIIIGLHTFLEHLSGMRVRVWTDNTGGEGTHHTCGTGWLFVLACGIVSARQVHSGVAPLRRKTTTTLYRPRG